MSDIQVPHIKANSIVPVQLPIPIINGIYQLYQYLLDSYGAVNIDALKVKFESRLPLTANEMSLITCTQLLQLVNSSAQANGMVEYKSLDSTIAQGLSATPAS